MTDGKEGVLYAYGVVERAGVVECPSKGIDDAPVTVLEHDGVAILASVLSAKRFGARMWEEHAEDPVWLEEVARQHHGVLQHVAATGDVVPLRMPSVYTSEASARQMMDSRQQLLREAMQRVRARLEWGVKIYLDPGSEGASGDSTGERPASGRDYLAQRSEQATQREQGRQQRVTAVTQVHESLAEAAANSVSNPPQDSALSGRSEPMMLNAAYLVDRSRSESFAALARELADGPCARHGLLLEVTGPWPVYNFAVVPEP